VLIGSAGVAIDLSTLMMRRRQAQNAADLGALAAAVSLPGNPTAARNMAARIVAANDYRDGVNGVRVTITTPVAGDSSRIQVAVRDSVATIFMRLLGNDATVLTRNAIAVSPAPPYGLYSTKPCGAVPSSIVWTMNGSHISIPIRSNGNFTLTGSTNTITGGVEYACSQSIVGSGNSLLPPPVKNATGSASPITFAQSAFTPCKFNLGSQDLSNPGAWWVGGTSASKTLVDGIYCSTGSLTLTGNGITGTVTLVAATVVTITGTSLTLKPFKNNVLVAAYGTGVTSVTGSGGTWSGFYYVPNGTIQLTGSSNWLVNGGLVAAAINITGSATTFALTGGSSAPLGPLLVK
jgi:hypothetical protein